MSIDSHEMSKTVRHEDGSQPHFHHLVNVTLNETKFLQFFKLYTICQQVHVNPGYSYMIKMKTEISNVY